MPVFGISTALGQPCAGLMRSTDGGQTWGDFLLIASDAETGFTHPAVLATGGQSLVAMVHAGGRLYRSRSEDAGYHWTTPEPVLIGREPQLVRITDQAIACVTATGSSGWGYVLVYFSYNDFEIWRCERKVMEHIGRSERERQGHFGWPTALALDSEHLLIALGRTQLHISEMDGPASRPISPEEERIEVVYFERDGQTPRLSLAEKVTPSHQHDCWEYVEHRRGDWPRVLGRAGEGELIGVTGQQATIWLAGSKAVWGAGGPEELWRSSDGGRTWQRQPMNVPPDFRGSPSVVAQLASGRLLLAVHQWLLSEWNDGNKRVIGQRGGYSVWEANIEDFTRGEHTSCTPMMRAKPGRALSNPLTSPHMFGPVLLGATSFNRSTGPLF